MEAPVPEEANPTSNIPLVNLMDEFYSLHSTSRCKEICNIIINYMEDQPNKSQELLYLSSVKVLKVFAKGLQKEFDMKCLSNAPSAILNLISLLCDKECIDFQKIQCSNVLQYIVLIVQRITEEFIHPKKMWGRDYTLTIENIWGWALKICSNFVFEFDEKSLIPTNNVLIFFHVKTILDWFLEEQFTKSTYSHILPENFYDIVCDYIIKALQNRLYVELMNRLGLKSFYKFLKTKRDEAPEWIKNFDVMIFQILILLSKEIADELLEARIMFILNEYLRLNYDYLSQNRKNLHYTHLEVRNAYLLLIAHLILHDQALIQFHYLQMTRSLMYLNYQLGGNEQLIHSICHVVESEAYTCVQIKAQEGLKNPESCLEIRSILESSSVIVGDLFDEPILESENVQEEIQELMVVQSEVEKPSVEPEIEKTPVEENHELQSDSNVSKFQMEKEEGEIDDDDDDSSLEFVGDIEDPGRSRKDESDLESPEYSSSSPQYSSEEDIDMDFDYHEDNYEEESEIEYSNNQLLRKLDYPSSSDFDENIDVEETKDHRTREFLRQYYENNKDRQNMMKKEFPEKSRFSKNPLPSSVDKSDFMISSETSEIKMERSNALDIFSVHLSETASERQQSFGHQNLLIVESDHGNLVESSKTNKEQGEPHALENFHIQPPAIHPSKLPQASKSDRVLLNDEHQTSSQNYSSVVRLCSSDYGGSSEDENNFVEECLEESFSKSMSASTSTPNRSFESEIDRSYSELDKSVYRQYDLEEDSRNSKKFKTDKCSIKIGVSNFVSQIPKLGLTQENSHIGKPDEIEGQESDSDVEFVDEWKESSYESEVLNSEDPNSELDLEIDETDSDLENSESNLKTSELNEFDSETEKPNLHKEMLVEHKTYLNEKLETSENSSIVCIEAQNKTDSNAEEMKVLNFITHDSTGSRLGIEKTVFESNEKDEPVSEDFQNLPSFYIKSDIKTENDFINEDLVGHNMKITEADCNITSKIYDLVSKEGSSNKSSNAFRSDKKTEDSDFITRDLGHCHLEKQEADSEVRSKIDDLVSEEASSYKSNNLESDLKTVDPDLISKDLDRHELVIKEADSNEERKIDKFVSDVTSSNKLICEVVMSDSRTECPVEINLKVQRGIECSEMIETVSDQPNSDLNYDQSIKENRKFTNEDLVDTRLSIKLEEDTECSEVVETATGSSSYDLEMVKKDSAPKETDKNESNMKNKTPVVHSSDQSNSDLDYDQSIKENPNFINEDLVETRLSLKLEEDTKCSEMVETATDSSSYDLEINETVKEDSAPKETDKNESNMKNKTPVVQSSDQSNSDLDYDQSIKENPNFINEDLVETRLKLEENTECCEMVETATVSSSYDLEINETVKEDSAPKETDENDSNMKKITPVVHGQESNLQKSFDLPNLGTEDLKAEDLTAEPGIKIEKDSDVPKIVETDKKYATIKALESSNFDDKDPESESPYERKDIKSLGKLHGDSNSKIETSNLDGQNTTGLFKKFDNTDATSPLKHSRKRMRSIFDLSDTSNPDESMDSLTSCSDPQSYPLDLHFKSPSHPLLDSSPRKKCIKLSPNFDELSGPCIKNENPFSEIERCKLGLPIEGCEGRNINLENEDSREPSSAGLLKLENKIMDLSTQSSLTEESENTIEQDSKLRHTDASDLLSEESVEMDLEISDDLDLISEPKESNLEPNSTLVVSKRNTGSHDLWTLEK